MHKPFSSTQSQQCKNVWGTLWISRAELMTTDHNSNEYDCKQRSNRTYPRMNNGHTATVTAVHARSSILNKRKWTSSTTVNLFDYITHKLSDSTKNCQSPIKTHTIIKLSSFRVLSSSFGCVFYFNPFEEYQ